MEYTSFKTKMMEAFRVRMYFFVSSVGFIFFILVVQLVNLQIISGREYAQKSRANMENYIPITASRGEIYDRNFKYDEKNVIIVSNRPSFNITTVPEKFKSKKKLQDTMRRVSKLLKVSYESLMQDMSNRNPWERIIIKEDVDFDTIIKIATNQNIFPNVDWEDAPVRVYNFGEMFAHSLGYIGSISSEEYKKLKSEGYKHYQKIGKSGIEKSYDRLLRGEDGYVRRIVDVRNRTEGEEVGLQPIAGNNMVLTMDYEIQRVAYDAMRDHQKGALVVLKPASGEVLALISKPDFDPNLIISKDNQKIITDLSGDKNRPFLNRAIQSKYPPASTFKLVTTIAGLESGKVLPNRSYHCAGKYTLKGYKDHDFFCYETHGTLDLYWAIAKSCSVYFYQLGLSVGPTNILSYAEYFGLNEKTGIDLPGEISGFVPSRKWKYKTFGQPWYDGDTVNLSIGQGFVTVTPVEMVNLISGLVNNGIVYKPHLVREIRTNDNRKIIKSFKREKVREIPLSQLTIQTVKQGMRLSVTSGTSGRLGVLKVPLAGKTGTAQTRSKRKEDFSQHAWFVGYGPYEEDPEKAVAVAVLVEYGVAGAASAVPIAERIFYKLNELGYFK